VEEEVRIFKINLINPILFTFSKERNETLDELASL